MHPWSIYLLSEHEPKPILLIVPQHTSTSPMRDYIATGCGCVDQIHHIRLCLIIYFKRWSKLVAGRFLVQDLHIADVITSLKIELRHLGCPDLHAVQVVTAVEIESLDRGQHEYMGVLPAAHIEPPQLVAAEGAQLGGAAQRWTKLARVIHIHKLERHGF